MRLYGEMSAERTDCGKLVHLAARSTPINVTTQSTLIWETGILPMVRALKTASASASGPSLCSTSTCDRSSQLVGSESIGDSSRRLDARADRNQYGRSFNPSRHKADVQ